MILLKNREFTSDNKEQKKEKKSRKSMGVLILSLTFFCARV